MNGIYFINENIEMDGKSKSKSIQTQKEALEQYIDAENIQVKKLNPYQLYDHYSIPHALLYDLKKTGDQFDSLILYSPEVLKDYIKTYPARWLLIKSFFNKVITIRN